MLVGALQGREIHIVVAPKVWRLVSKVKTNFKVARFPPAALRAPAPFTGGRLWFVRTLQADLRGVVGAAPYRVCANIGKGHFVFRRGGFYILLH